MAETITPPDGVTEESDLASLQQLSTGFESFNQVIADNIARAKTIIQEAAAARAQATQDIADERARFEQELADKQAAFDAAAAAEQARLDGQRAQLLAAAQAVVNNEWPEPATPSAPVAVVTPPAPAAVAAAPVADDEIPAATIAAEITAEPAEETATEASAAVEIEETPAPVPAATEPAAPAAPAASSESAPSTEPTRTTVIVHGIHKPAVATGLQRFLLGQPGISGVEPREFAEGILRLQVRGTVPISEGLFAGWSDGEGMTVIQRVPQTVEVILPTAS